MSENENRKTNAEPRDEARENAATRDPELERPGTASAVDDGESRKSTEELPDDALENVAGGGVW